MSLQAAASTGITVSPSQAFRCVRKVLKAGRVPMLHGSPAIGKSSIIHNIAQKAELLVLDLRLGQCEPTDMLGFPYVDLVKFKSGYVPMDTFPVAGDELPAMLDSYGNTVYTQDANGEKIVKRYKGWLLFLDELTSAPSAVQAAAYKLILDRMVGQSKLHPMCFMVGAGNLESDNAVVHPMSTALQTRLCHLKLRLDVKEWLSWAMDEKFDHRITDYIQFNERHLYTFDPDHTDLTYASPRTWHMNNDLLVKGCDGNVKDVDFLALSSGNVTEGVSREFITFTEIYQHLPKMSDIIANPTGTPVPNEPGTLFALTGSLGNHADKENIEKIMQYIIRMPLEFQVVTMRYVVKRDRGMKSVPVVASWLAAHIATLF